MIRIYPVNPYALWNFRAAFAHGGGKNDPVDARLILKFLQDNREHLQPLKQDSPATTELLALTRERRNLVEERVALANRIGDLMSYSYHAARPNRWLGERLLASGFALSIDAGRVRSPTKRPTT